MIKSIKKLKQFGIFKNYTNDSAKTKDFGKFNLFYGYNGSGKSTLSDVFRCIEKKTASSEFLSSDSEFTVSIDAGKEITQENVADESRLNIYTFNRNFIDENISWDGIVKSILLIDTEKIEEHGNLEELKKISKTENKKYQTENEERINLEKAIFNFLTTRAKLIKTHFQLIGTTDKYYLNYSKLKFEKFIQNNFEKIKSDDSILDDQKYQELIDAIKPVQKNLISFNQQAINQETFTKAKDRLDDLLKNSVVSQTIQRLLEHGDIKSWVETGLELHNHYDTNQCEFCGNTITEERKKQLEAHFNNDYKAFQTRIKNADDWLANRHIQPPALPATSDFYDAFKNEYGKAWTALTDAIAVLNKEITAWHNVLQEKKADPFETNLTVEAISESSVKAYHDAIKAISTAVDKHNNKSRNFTAEIKKAQKQLELHYATNEIKEFAYHDKKQRINDKKEKNERLRIENEHRDAEIRTLENSLSNERIGADQFNKMLHSFLGRSDLTLHFDQSKKGYEIRRINQLAKNLSEGEKTAIAFVYFITKLKENDNNIEDTIVVVDDPISSFDSNHLFHACYFMKMHCKNAKQLFVLTHNFAFFKLVRDSMFGKKGNIYVVEENNDKNSRIATYADAKKALIDYNSEYHYIFSRLYLLEHTPTPDYFLAANLARKLLESFFAFKFPKHKKPHSRFDAAVRASENPEDVRKEKIRKFINNYSHSDSIETDGDDDSIENMMSESDTIISDIFEWIRELDANHYKEMIEVVKD